MLSRLLCNLVIHSILRDSFERVTSTTSGIVRMKFLTRSYVWWPKINLDANNEMLTMSDCSEKPKESKQTSLGRPQFSLTNNTPVLFRVIFGT